jgi:hypothetical protein
MCSRVLSLVVSLMLLLSSVLASAPASAAPAQQALAVLVAADQASGELPASDAAGHDQADSLLDIPDQLAGPRAQHLIALHAYRVEQQVAVSLTHPHLKGPQRPPRASGLAA